MIKSMLTKNERYEKAIEDFDKTIELKPNHADAHYFRAVAYALLGKYEDARSGLIKAQNLYKRQGDKRGEEIVDLYWKQLDELQQNGGSLSAS